MALPSLVYFARPGVPGSGSQPITRLLTLYNTSSSELNFQLIYDKKHVLTRDLGRDVFQNSRGVGESVPAIGRKLVQSQNIWFPFVEERSCSPAEVEEFVAWDGAILSGTDFVEKVDDTASLKDVAWSGESEGGD
jgi:hypothetical protein